MAFPNLSEIVTTTLRNRTGELADNMSRNNALLARASGLADGILSRSESLRRSNVQHPITGVPLERLVIGVVKFLDDSTTAGEGFNLAATIQASKQRIVAAHIVCQLPCARAQGSRYDF